MSTPLVRLSAPLSMVLVCTAGGCGSDPAPVATVTPFELKRIPKGEPVSAAGRAEVTEQYLEILRVTGYFQYIADRVHGWPADAPGGEYHFGTWWSGVKIVRTGTTVVFDHPPDGSDNNGLRTAPMLEGVCYAHALWKKPEHEALMQELIRGFNAWIMAMERSSAPGAPVMMTRAFYPPAVTTTRGGLAIRYDYADQRPGLDNPATEYVHLPDNPHWGDIWVKNKRSKDDLGHMLRALDVLEACQPTFGAATRAEYTSMQARYRAFARQIEDDGFRIATWNKALEKWIPEESLAIFVQLLDTECNAMLTFRVLGRGDTGGRDCKNGITDADELAAALNDHARHIFLSFHQAAIHHLLRAGLDAPALTLAGGLALRGEKVLDALESDAPPTHFDAKDFAGELAHAANLGVPLTWREIRHLHAAIREAHAYYTSPDRHFERSPFAAEAADGQYPFDPGSVGFNFRELGVLLGFCASPTTNSAAEAPLDCARIAQGI